MKKKTVFFGLLTFMLVFCLIGCSSEAGGNGIENGEDDPPLTGTVTITGTAKVGETLTANTTGLSTGIGTISYQWNRVTANNQTTSIGTNSSTYQIVEADINHTITVTVTRAGNSGSVTSSATLTIVSADLPTLTGIVTITGNAMAGQTLTANASGLVAGTGLLTYQWKRVDNNEETTDIGTNVSTYNIVEADIDHTIIVTVTRDGHTGSVTSNPTAIVIRPYWTIAANSTFGTDTINKIAFANNRFVAVGNNGRIAYSSDNGVTWTSVANTTFTSIIQDVTASMDRIIAVGAQGRIAYSSDNGVTWTAVTTSTFAGAINTVAGYPGVWIAGGADGRMARSINYGETWTSVTTSTFGFTNINSVAARDANRFVAVGNNGRIAYSSDAGFSWTAVENSPFGTTAIRHISWAGIMGGNRFVAVGNNGMTAYSSDNGATWTLVTDGSFGVNEIRGLAWNNSGRGVAVGSLGRIAYTQH